MAIDGQKTIVTRNEIVEWPSSRSRKISSKRRSGSTFSRRDACARSAGLSLLLLPLARGRRDARRALQLFERLLHAGHEVRKIGQ